jgi:hypothetical protein
VHAQQIEAGEQAAEHRASDVAGVEHAQPRHAGRRGLDPPRDGRQRCAHHQRRRQQTDGRDQGAQHDVAPSRGGIQRVDERHAPEQQQSGRANAQLETGVDLQRVISGMDRARQQQAAETHSAHEGAEQNTQRDGRRADHQL